MTTKTPASCDCRASLTDDAFVASFENLTLPDDAFRHADHVRLAWIYLSRMPLLDAIRVYRDGLRRFAAANGAPERYHETVTWAFIILIHERMFRGPTPSWPEFAAANADLLRWRDGALFARYGPGILESDVAREIFVLPGPSTGKASAGPREAVAAASPSRRPS